MAKGEQYSWKTIKQTLPARLRTGRVILRFVITVIIAFIVGGTMWSTSQKLFPNKALQTLKKIHFHSDGPLSSKWALQHYPLKLNMDLMKIDIHRYKKKLESYSQIKSVQIKRKFPNAIQIRIYEHKPIAKVCVQQKGRKKLLLVSQEGQIFEPHGYTKEKIKSLPWIVEYRLKAHSNHWKSIPNFKKISDLLHEMHKSSPTFFQKIDHISLAKFDTVSAPWSIVTLITTEKKHLRFFLKNIQDQITKLNAIFSRLNSEEWENLKSIDLSLKSPVLQFKQTLRHSQ